MSCTLLLRLLIPALFLALLGAAALTTFVDAQDTPTPNPKPESVTVAGTIQALLGCPGDWQPECANTFMTYDRRRCSVDRHF